MLYKVFMIIAVPVMAICWLAYWLWNKKMDEQEKNQPKVESQRLVQTKSEITDWAKKMATADSPAEQARKRREALEKEWDEREQREKEQQKQQENK